MRRPLTTTWLLGLWLIGAALGGCALPHLPPPGEPSHAYVRSDQTPLGRMFSGVAAAHPGASGFRVLARGSKAFVTRLELADAAERSLDLQYYSAADDSSSALLLSRIASAAQRGVRVRLLLDDIDVRTRRFARQAAALPGGIQVRLFNPFLFGGTSSLGRLVEFAVDGERLNRRMHNKLWVADGAAAIVGSRNLGDEYFDAHATSNFADVELLAVGPIVDQLSTAFDAYWNSESAVAWEAIVEATDRPDAASVQQRLRDAAPACADTAACGWLAERGLLADLDAGSTSLLWGTARLSWDAPDRDKVAPASGLEHGSIDDHPGGLHVQRELLIVSPYFVPSAEGLEHLARMREGGARLAVLTNSLASTDSPAAHAGYARHRVHLLEGGVELYEMRPLPGAAHKRSHRWGHASPASLHAKAIVRDRRQIIVGSFNQDPRSRLHNTEIWVEVDNTELASDLAALFDEGTALEHALRVSLDGDRLVWDTEEDESPVRYTDEPMVDRWLRLWRSTLGALIPEHLL